MDSNFTFTIRRLPNGDALLCDGGGDPIACNSRGELIHNGSGIPMTVKQYNTQGGKRAQVEVSKVELADYADVLKNLYQPRLNLRTQQLELNGTEINEAEFEALHVEAAKEHRLQFNKGDFQAVLRSLAWKSSYDPITTYINSLGVEDGPILSDAEWDAIAVSALGLGDSWSRTVVQRFLLSAVARVMDPGCKVDFCLILHGPQGLGKSSFFAALGGEYFCDSMGNLDNKKDDLMILHRNWINEWSEADQIFVGANKSEQIKRFVSSQEDTFRAPYGRTTSAFKRRSVLCGTTNRDDWANDPTGNRRFPVLSPIAIDADWITENRNKIWARAAVEWRKGTRWWFSKEEEQRITEQATKFAPTNDDVEIAFAYLRQNKGEWVSTRELIIHALNQDPDRIDQRKVSGFSRQMSGLVTRGVIKEVRNHQGRTAQSPSRIRTTCWKAVDEMSGFDE